MMRDQSKLIKQNIEYLAINNHLLIFIKLQYIQRLQYIFPYQLQIYQANMQKNDNNQSPFQTSKNQFLTQFQINKEQRTRKINFAQQQKIIQKNKKLKKNESSKWKKSINNKDQKIFVQIYQAPKPQIEKQFQQLRKASLLKKILPGPGQYNIAKPIVKPNYQTLQKNQEVVLIKVNNNGGTANFKANQNRFGYIYNQQNMLTPGPGDYQTISSQRKVFKKQQPHYHINYDSIRQLYLHNYQKVDSIPNITIQKTSQNNHYIGKPRKLQQLQIQLKQKLNQKEKKQRVKLLKNAKSFNSSLKSLWNSQKSMTEKQNMEQKRIFPLPNVDENNLSVQQNQIYEKKQIMMQTLYKINKSIEEQKLNQLKLRKILEANPTKIKEKKQNSKVNGYYNNNQIDRSIYQKYNVKLDFNKQNLKKIMTKQKKFQTLQVSTNFSKSRKYLKEKQNKNNINSISLNLRQQLQKYNRNMIDILSMSIRQPIMNEQIQQKRTKYIRNYLNSKMALDQIVVQGKSKLDQSKVYINQRYSSIQ